ncbi:hypothetical protein HPB48_005692 [Haemaphysalis longicornis]|uniref:CCHC-type domain-containing protein n=1 Tax=Haemaphysalis longicornis TaxID=44386 RepID=A0A9J6GSN0_HAELO|nr:hypothetical protein HPB48_005692 [Haemaphysalis longicornis]
MSSSTSSPRQAPAGQELHEPVQQQLLVADASSHYPTMNQAPDAVMHAQSKEQNEEDSAMHTDSTEESGSPAKWAYDENSGRTIDLQHQWKVTERKRNKTDATHGAPPAAQPTSQHSAPETAQQKRSRMPPLPVDGTKIIYRPQAGLQLSKWSLADITNAIGRASKIMQKEFYDNVRIQVQHIENFVIASTPRKDLAFDFLGEICSIQLGRDIFTVRAHVKTPEWISRGVINGVPPNTSPRELMDGLRVPERYTVVAARMLGKSSAAVIYFNGPHVPFNVTYQSGDYRCQPYHKTVQYCHSCGKLGHRRGICAHPAQNVCHKCGHTNQPPGHECRPYCKICKQPHETAGTDCRQKLKPGPPLHKVRQQWEVKSGDPRSGWRPRTEDFPDLQAANSTTSKSSNNNAQRSRDRSRAPSQSRSGSRAPSQKRVSYANVASESGRSSEDEAAIKAL